MWVVWCGWCGVVWVIGVGVIIVVGAVVLCGVVGVVCIREFSSILPRQKIVLIFATALEISSKFQV